MKKMELHIDKHETKRHAAVVQRGKVPIKQSNISTWVFEKTSSDPWCGYKSACEFQDQISRWNHKMTYKETNSRM